MSGRPPRLSADDGAGKSRARQLSAAPSQRDEGTDGSVFELFPVLKERRNSAAGVLSGGQQQMLAIGRGLMAIRSC